MRKGRECGVSDAGRLLKRSRKSVCEWIAACYFYFNILVGSEAVR